MSSHGSVRRLKAPLRQSAETARAIYDARRPSVDTLVTGISMTGDVVAALTLSPRPNSPIWSRSSKTAGSAASSRRAIAHTAPASSGRSALRYSRQPLQRHLVPLGPTPAWSGTETLDLALRRYDNPGEVQRLLDRKRSPDPGGALEIVPCQPGLCPLDVFASWIIVRIHVHDAFLEGKDFGCCRDLHGPQCPSLGRLDCRQPDHRGPDAADTPDIEVGRCRLEEEPARRRLIVEREMCPGHLVQDACLLGAVTDGLKGSQRLLIQLDGLAVVAAQCRELRQTAQREA